MTMSEESKPKKDVELDPPKDPKTLAARLRARAENRHYLMVNLSDRDRRLSAIILGHIADVVEGRPEPKIEVPAVHKRNPVAQ